MGETSNQALGRITLHLASFNRKPFCERIQSAFHAECAKIKTLIDG